MRLQPHPFVAAHFCGRARPLRSTRSTHLMADDPLTPNRAAAARRLIPSTTTALITRSRNPRVSPGHPCWPPPSQQVESDQARFRESSLIQPKCGPL